MRISVVQMSPGADKAANLRTAEMLVRACQEAERPDLIILPEIWTCLGGDRAQKFAAAETLPGGPAYTLLQTLARALQIFLHGGSIGELRATTPDHLHNTSVVFNPAGEEIARYSKIHLFDITTPDGHGYRESATYAAGNEIVTADIAGLTLGLAICYDLRFPALFAALRAKGADLIALPAAFTAQTGRDHWDPLLRARAIETQCWFAAAATCGRHTEQTRTGPVDRFTHGHSMIIDPWGHVVARASDGPGFATARLDQTLTARVRRDMPIAEHQRLPFPPARP